MRAVSAQLVPESGELEIDFCGERYTPTRIEPFNIGREGDLAVDDNLYLHRRFLQISHLDGIWWLENVGARLSATISEASGGFQAWLSPGARIPLVFSETNIIFTAGSTSYEFSVRLHTPPFRREITVPATSSDTTVGPVVLTDSQRALIVALAEPLLRRSGDGVSSMPSSADAARRLGWSASRFNRKLDNVCDKLDKAGVRGLRGSNGNLALNRRPRLVEHAVMSQLVTAADLPLLERLREEDEG